LYKKLVNSIEDTLSECFFCFILLRRRTSSARAGASDGSVNGARYELSHKLSRPTDLREICWAVSFSMTSMEPPQQGQRQEQSRGGKSAVTEATAGIGAALSSLKHSGRSARRRLGKTSQQNATDGLARV
jgi:hypothetical protein